MLLKSSIRKSKIVFCLPKTCQFLRKFSFTGMQLTYSLSMDLGSLFVVIFTATFWQCKWVTSQSRLQFTNLWAEILGIDDFLSPLLPLETLESLLPRLWFVWCVYTPSNASIESLLTVALIYIRLVWITCVRCARVCMCMCVCTCTCMLACNYVLSSWNLVRTG